MSFPCFTHTSSSDSLFFFSSMVSSYLVHHGYCSTATAFARVTDTMIQEEQTSIKNRQSKHLGWPLQPSVPHCHVLPAGLCRGAGKYRSYSTAAQSCPHHTLVLVLMPVSQHSLGTAAGRACPIVTVPPPPSAVLCYSSLTCLSEETCIPGSADCATFSAQFG